MQLYNTLTKTIDEFVPVDGNIIRPYITTLISEICAAISKKTYWRSFCATAVMMYAVS